MGTRLLFLSQCLPYPPHSGVTNRTYNILKGLSKSFEITLLPFTRKNHQPGLKDIMAAKAAIERLGIQVRGPFRIASEQSRSARIAVHARSLVSGEAYTHFEYGDPSFATALHQVLRDWRPDLVHVDSLDLHRWLPVLEGLPVACTHHSLESDLLRRRAAREQSRALGAYIRRQASIMERIEQNWCARLSMNVMMSEHDAGLLAALVPTAPTLVAPNGVDVEAIRPLAGYPTSKGRVAFLGPSYMLPNRDAIEFFLREVWHLVRNARPDATFQIIGKVEDRHRVVYESYPGVTCAGFVEDLRPVLAAAECCVVPLRIGGGTRLKILDTWAMGRPIVSTSVGCEGLKTIEGANILIRDTPEDFAAGVIRVLGSPETQKLLGEAGRRCVEQDYSWDTIGASLASAYQGLLGARQPRAATI